MRADSDAKKAGRIHEKDILILSQNAGFEEFIASGIVVFRVSVHIRFVVKYKMTSHGITTTKLIPQDDNIINLPHIYTSYMT